ncbi:MAG: MazG nucleotide pyrophosphohydrolase domain-containing protein [Planctomycetaceae bacterium]|nr:hypothetical protein [Planctomycetaceae bacterium]
MTITERKLWEYHVRHYGEGVNVPKTVRKFMEEVGELCEAIIVGKKLDIMEELGDAATVLFVLSVGLGFDGLEHVMRSTAAKLEDRDNPAAPHDDQQEWRNTSFANCSHVHSEPAGTCSKGIMPRFHCLDCGLYFLTVER